MSLASNYAAVMKDLEVKKVVAYMKSKGHLSLLPQVLNILERGTGDTDVVRVARKEDLHLVEKKFPGATMVVDPTIVGGYLARKGSKLIDATYRKTLVTIYRNTTRDTHA